MTFTARTSPEHRSIYGALCNAIARCHNPEHPAYNRYGARGITVCEEWRSLDYMNFYNHIGPKPTEKHTLDRIDNDKGYEPGNVKWSTRKEQSRNLSTSIAPEVMAIVDEIMARTGVSLATAKYRVKNFSPERYFEAARHHTKFAKKITKRKAAIFTPLRREYNNGRNNARNMAICKDWDESLLSILDIAKKYNVSQRGVRVIAGHPTGSTIEK